MKIFKIVTAMSLIGIMFLLSSCGTIITGGRQSIPINSNPSEATVKISDANGQVVQTATTPCTVELNKGTGYFKKAEYSVEIEKSGYAPVQIQLTGDMNIWYLGGNLVFGGFVGWLVVDPLTGGMWTLSPEEITADLKTSSFLFDQEEGLHVVLKEDVPTELLPYIVPITPQS